MTALPEHSGNSFHFAFAARGGRRLLCVIGLSIWRTSNSRNPRPTDKMAGRTAELQFNADRQACLQRQPTYLHVNTNDVQLVLLGLSRAGVLCALLEQATYDPAALSLTADTPLVATRAIVAVFIEAASAADVVDLVKTAAAHTDINSPNVTAVDGPVGVHLSALRTAAIQGAVCGAFLRSGWTIAGDLAIRTSPSGAAGNVTTAATVSVSQHPQQGFVDCEAVRISISPEGGATSRHSSTSSCVTVGAKTVAVGDSSAAAASVKPLLPAKRPAEPVSSKDDDADDDSDASSDLGFDDSDSDTDSDDASICVPVSARKARSTGPAGNGQLRPPAAISARTSQPPVKKAATAPAAASAPVKAVAASSTSPTVVSGMQGTDRSAPAPPGRSHGLPPNHDRPLRFTVRLTGLVLRALTMTAAMLQNDYKFDLSLSKTMLRAGGGVTGAAGAGQLALVTVPTPPLPQQLRDDVRVLQVYALPSLTPCTIQRVYTPLLQQNGSLPASAAAGGAMLPSSAVPVPTRLEVRDVNASTVALTNRQLTESDHRRRLELLGLERGLAPAASTHTPTAAVVAASGAPTLALSPSARAGDDCAGLEYARVTVGRLPLKMLLAGRRSADGAGNDGCNEGGNRKNTCSVADGDGEINDDDALAQLSSSPTHITPIHALVRDLVPLRFSSRIHGARIATEAMRMICRVAMSSDYNGGDLGINGACSAVPGSSRAGVTVVTTIPAGKAASLARSIGLLPIAPASPPPAAVVAAAPSTTPSIQPAATPAPAATAAAAGKSKKGTAAAKPATATAPASVAAPPPNPMPAPAPAPLPPLLQPSEYLGVLFDPPPSSATDGIINVGMTTVTNGGRGGGGGNGVSSGVAASGSGIDRSHSGGGVSESKGDDDDGDDDDELLDGSDSEDDAAHPPTGTAKAAVAATQNPAAPAPSKVSEASALAKPATKPSSSSGGSATGFPGFVSAKSLIGKVSAPVASLDETLELESGTGAAATVIPKPKPVARTLLLGKPLGSGQMSASALASAATAAPAGVLLPASKASLLKQPSLASLTSAAKKTGSANSAAFSSSAATAAASALSLATRASLPAGKRVGFSLSSIGLSVYKSVPLSMDKSKGGSDVTNAGETAVGSGGTDGSRANDKASAGMRKAPAALSSDSNSRDGTSESMSGGSSSTTASSRDGIKLTPFMCWLLGLGLHHRGGNGHRNVITVATTSQAPSHAVGVVSTAASTATTTTTVITSITPLPSLLPRLCWVGSHRTDAVPPFSLLDHLSGGLDLPLSVLLPHSIRAAAGSGDGNGAGGGGSHTGSSSVGGDAMMMLADLGRTAITGITATSASSAPSSSSTSVRLPSASVHWQQRQVFLSPYASASIATADSIVSTQRSTAREHRLKLAPSPYNFADAWEACEEEARAAKERKRLEQATEAAIPLGIA